MHRLITLLLTALFSLYPALFAMAQDGPFVPGDLLPEFSMTAPEQPEHRQYLGLDPDSATFTLEDVNAEAVLIQIFSMYCPICQREAPDVNKLYAAIEAEGLADKLKVLGLGAGNSDLEVQVFRERYEVPFPMFSDPDYTLHNLFQAVGTPYYLLVQPAGGPDGGHVVRLSHLGRFGEMNVFFERLLNAKQ